MTNIRPFMGRKQFKTVYNPINASQPVLNRAFQASMKDVIGDLMDFVAHMENVAPDILVEALEPTLGKAMEYCPYDQGVLRDSAYLEARKFRGGAEVEIGFGRGGNPDYAIYVHEIPRFHEPPTRDKFLQSAIEEDYFSIITSIPRLCSEAAGL